MALIFFQKENGRPCRPMEAYRWCQEGELPYVWHWVSEQKPPAVGKEVEEGTYLPAEDTQKQAREQARQQRLAWLHNYNTTPAEER